MKYDNKVLFLGYSSIEGGLLFPNEINRNEYCTSVFIILNDGKKPITNRYDFLVCEKEETYYLDLNKNEGESMLFSLNIENYQVDFEVIKSRYSYLGEIQEIFRGKILYQIIPIQTDILEMLVHKKDLFLVGDTPEE